MSPHTISKKEAWLLATRPRTLPAAIAPVCLAASASVYMGKFHVFPAFCAFLTAILLQIAVNLANDYFDAKKGHDTSERLGPLRVTQSGLIPAKQVFCAMVFCLGVAVLSGLPLLFRGGLPILILGVSCVLGVLAYSAGPFPMTEKATGEFFSFLFFGPLGVCAVTWVISLEFSWRVLFLSIPAGLLVASILMVNNIRDIPSDTKTGKRTLAVRLGKNPSRYLFTLTVMMAYLFPLVDALYHSEPLWLLPFLSFPKAIVVIQSIWQMEGKLLNDVLADTAKLCLFFCLLYSASLLLLAGLE